MGGALAKGGGTRAVSEKMAPLVWTEFGLKSLWSMDETGLTASFEDAGGAKGAWRTGPGS